MQNLEVKAVRCPCCGQTVEISVDRSDIGNSYEEDCPACCNPIVLSITLLEDSELSIRAERENS